jgi:HlyD family secretion protein
MQNQSQPPVPPAKSSRRRPGRTRRAVVLSTVALVVLAGGAAGINALASANSSSSHKQQTLDTHLVTLSSFEVTTTSSGELEAKNQIEVRSELENSSTIVEVIEEGKVAKKGDVLVRLNSDQVQTQITDVDLRVETAKADLEKAETAVEIQKKENASKISLARVKVLLAELAFKQWDQGEKEQKTADHATAIVKAEEELVRLKEKYDKCVELQAKGFVSTDQMKRDKLEHDDAVRALAKAILAKSIFEKYEIESGRASKQSDVDQAKEELERVMEQSKIELKSKEAEKVSAQRKLDTNVEHLAKLKRQLEKSTIIAPADGLVVYATSMERSRRGWGDDGPLSIGRQVFPNEALIILPDTSEMVATVRVHETLASRIKEGLQATVKVDAVGGRTFNAKVVSIGILAESSGWRDPNLREYTVKLGLNNSDLVEMKPSMRCEAEIIMGSVENALSVPIQAVHNDGMLRYVHVQESGSSKYLQRPIKLGRISESLGEVVAGLKEGERVLLRKPAAGEVLDREFTGEELAAVGLKQESGQIVMVSGGGKGPGTNGGRRGGGKPGGAGGEQRKGERGGAADGIAAKDKQDDKAKPDAAGGKETEAVKPADTKGAETSTSTETISKGSSTTAAKQ